MKRVILLSSLYLIFGLSYPNMLFAESGLVFHASSGTITGRLDMAGFDIDSVGEIDATRYQINGSTMVAILPGTGSLGVGVDAGRVNTGNNNSFVGYRSGYNTTTGNYNSFLGYKAGHSNTIGGANSFVGFQAGYNNTGNYNSFVGGNAGYNNTTGINNSFLGYQAGLLQHHGGE